MNALIFVLLGITAARFTISADVDLLPDLLAHEKPLCWVRRQFVARPVFSTDDMQADKHKMERFLHGGRPSCASVYAPVTYGPMPVLAFKLEDGVPRLVFTGAAAVCAAADRTRLREHPLALTGATLPCGSHTFMPTIQMLAVKPPCLEQSQGIFHPIYTLEVGGFEPWQMNALNCSVGRS